jgi:hypothetical protein
MAQCTSGPKRNRSTTSAGTVSSPK